jgi:3-methylcrotonyl-CoA carboxylase alpha subunit
VRLCRHERYRGAGTVEFIVDAGSFDFFFLEMNTRIQVEHAVTEMTCGVDLVALQIDLARGRLAGIAQGDIAATGHAIECRLYAENPKKNFMPSPGKLAQLAFPEPRDDLRIDTGYRAGDTISFFYDPLIAKIICRGTDRADAIERMRKALDGVAVEGPATNLAFLRRTLDHPAFRRGEVSTGFVDAHRAALVE